MCGEESNRGIARYRKGEVDAVYFCRSGISAYECIGNPFSYARVYRGESTDDGIWSFLFIFIRVSDDYATAFYRAGIFHPWEINA